MLLIKLFVPVLIFFYFSKLSNTKTPKGVIHLIVFFSFYNIIKYSFVIVQDSIVALWIDGAILGLCLPILISCIIFSILPIYYYKARYQVVMLPLLAPYFIYFIDMVTELINKSIIKKSYNYLQKET